MRYGFVFPGGEAVVAAEFARTAEAAGWDGFFVWDPAWGSIHGSASPPAPW